MKLFDDLYFFVAKYVFGFIACLILAIIWIRIKKGK